MPVPGGDPYFALVSLGIFSITLIWSYPWIFWSHINPLCNNVLLLRIVVIQCPWIGFQSGRKGGICFPVLYTMTELPWLVGDHVGLCRTWWTCCLSLPSWVGPGFCCYRNSTIRTGTCRPCWRLLEIYLLGLLWFFYCGIWYWWTPHWRVSIVV